MATSAPRFEQRGFSIGTVISRTFAVLADNPLATFGCALLFGAIPQVLYSYFIGSQLANAEPGSQLAIAAISFGSMVVFLLFSMLVQGALVRATTAFAEGGRASFAECLSVGLSAAVPLIGLTILMVLALMAGFILFVIPGVILLLMWAVAVPALVTERIGVFAAFSRSRALTKGARWRIFGLYLLLFIVMWLFLILISLVLGIGGLTSGLAIQASQGTVPVTSLIVSGILNTITIAFWGAAQANLYIALRDWKDGPQGESLAEVFA
ncbi:hypothetical protein [Sphingobium ummariense]